MEQLGTSVKVTANLFGLEFCKILKSYHTIAHYIYFVLKKKLFEDSVLSLLFTLDIDISNLVQSTFIYLFLLFNNYYSSSPNGLRVNSP